MTAEHAMPKRSASRFLPEFAIISVILMWSSTAVVIKDTYEYISPLALTFTRFTIICVLALAILALFHRRTGSSIAIDRADLPRLVVCGLTGYTLYQIFYVLGLDRTTAFAASILGSLTPIFSILILTFLGERSHRIVWIGMMVSFTGALIFILGNGKADGGSLAGNLLCAAAPLVFAVYTIVSRPLVVKYPAPVFTAYTLIIGSIPIWIIGASAFQAQDWHDMPGRIWPIIVYLCIFPVYLAYQFWNYGIKHRGVATVSAYSLVIPVLGGIWAALWLNESLNGIKLIGGVLVMAGLVVMRQANRRKSA